MRQNISVTLDDVILKKIDEMADTERRSRSNMIEILLQEQLEENKSKNQE